jgi:hypothetical protein
MTWGVRQPTSKLITHISEGADSAEQLEEFVARDAGLVGVMIAGDVLTRAKESIKPLAYKAARARVRAMWTGVEEAARGPSVFLACFDRTSLWNLPAFYFRDGSLKGHREYQLLVNALINRTTSAHAISHVSESEKESLESIIYELFRNTHEWAREDVGGARIPRSIRGLLVEAHNATKSEFIETVEGSRPLEQYVNHDVFNHGSGRQRFLEVSVFDSGPGLAARWLSRDPTYDPLSTEYAACMSCLRKHDSSSGDGGRGLGLYKVMRMLTALKGFLRVRTGRLALYRDFESAPYLESDENEEIELFDWKTEAPTPVEAPSVEGTLYSMLIPLQQWGA